MTLKAKCTSECEYVWDKSTTTENNYYKDVQRYNNSCNEDIEKGKVFQSRRSSQSVVAAERTHVYLYFDDAYAVLTVSQLFTERIRVTAAMVAQFSGLEDSRRMASHREDPFDSLSVCSQSERVFSAACDSCESQSVAGSTK
jgi:hypothetical protein